MFIIYIFLFLPVCLFVYQLAPEKWRGRVLLGFSWIFFYLLSGKLLVYLLGTTLLTHCIGIWLTLLKTEEAKAVEGMDRKQKKVIKAEYQKKGRRVLILGILILLGVLGYLKYFDFFTVNLSHLFGHPVLEGWRPENLLMPIGISFYTLQAIGYMTDVYWGTIQAETEIWRTALFLGFFPVIVEGPICRWEDVEDTLFKNESVKAENVFKGCYRIIWGLFKKMIIADRLAVLVDKVYVGYESYSGAVIVVAAISYTIQLYMEFSGCMDMVIGSAFLEFACRRISASRFLQRHVQISGNDGTLHLVSGSRTISFIQYPFPRRPESGINLRENISKGILENMWREWELQQWHFSQYGSVMVCGTVRNGITFFTDYITLD